MRIGWVALRSFLRALGLLGLLGLIALGAGYWWFERNILSTLPENLAELRDYRPNTTCRLYAGDGTEVDQFYLERRIWVPLGSLPKVVWQAFVAAEDRRFLRHPGVDTLGILRAVVSNLLAGEVTQGGSTLTQQLVKNLLVGQEKSYRRKLKEAVLAYRLERELEKSEILELYLNFVYLGSGNYGVEAAARDYFGVPARQLDAGQAALIAGLVPAPSRYSPRVNPELAATRRRLVLRGMVEEGFVTPKEAQSFLEDPVVQPREQPLGQGVAGAYVTQVRREIRRLLGNELPFRQGLQVHTALDLKVQAVAQEAVREALVSLEERQGRSGAFKRLEPKEWPAFLAQGPGLERQARTGALVRPQRDGCFQALVGQGRDLGKLSAGPWTFTLLEGERQVRVRDLDSPEARPSPLAERVRPGDVLRVCLVESPGELVRLEARPWAEGAAVVLENATGRVVAMVGGWQTGLEGFVRATQARRQPGSSFKPYVYAAALLEGRTQLDTVVDAPLSLPAGNGKLWTPKNYTGKYLGPLPMRRALAQSLNTVAVRLALDAGPDRIAEVARAMGVRTPLRRDVTLALGSSEVTPMDQALGYATIARMGVPVEPVLIDRVEDALGTPVGAAGGPVWVGGKPVAQLPGKPLRRALPAGVAYELADMLREVVRSGTAVKAHVPGLDRAGKTGTTNANVDAWFVGFTPRHTIAVWIGTDGTFSLGDGETGGRAALPAWVRIADALPKVEGESLPLPDEAVLVPGGEAVGNAWVGLPRGSVPHALLALAPRDAAPLPDFPAEPPPLALPAAAAAPPATASAGAP
jgi:penicillin-binding protein 1A